MEPRCSTRDGKQATGTLMHSLRGGLAGSLNGLGPRGGLSDQLIPLVVRCAGTMHSTLLLRQRHLWSGSRFMALLYLMVHNCLDLACKQLFWVPYSFFFFLKNIYLTIWAFLVAQIRKNLPAMQETRVWSLAREDPLEKGMAIHSSILAWRIPWTEEPGGLQSMRTQRVGHNWAADTHLLFTWVFTWLHQALVAEHGIL